VEEVAVLVTAAEIIALQPCAAWTEERIRRVVGRGKTPTQIAKLADASIGDRRWALTGLAARTDAGRRALVSWAAGCAQDVANLATDEDAARCAISMAVAWAEGCATTDEVRDAACAAYASYAYARYFAYAGAAAYAAAYAAADAAADAAAAVAYAAAATAAAAAAAGYAAYAYADSALAEQHLLDLAAAMEAM
jgi:hypothetical protein